MTTKEKLDKKVNNIAIELVEKMRSISNFGSIKEMQDFSTKFNVDFDTVQKLFSDVIAYKKDQKDYKILSYISKNGTSGIGLYKELSSAREKVLKSEKIYKDDINSITLKSFISEIPASKVSIKVIDYLKEKNANKEILNEALNKYASNLKAEVGNNENLFKFLYENGYKPTRNNPLDLAYKYYSYGRKKDEKIDSLQMEVTEIEGIIHNNINTIKALKLKLSYYEQAVPNMQSKIKEFAQRAQNSVCSVKELQKQAEVKEKRGIFKTFFNKVAMFFKKDKPLLLSASLSGIQADMSAVSTGLTKVGNTVIKPENQEKIVEDIHERQRGLSLGFKKIAEPVKNR